MRQRRKNQRKMYYSLYDGQKYIDGTLEQVPSYGNPIEFDASLSAGTSESNENPFGKDTDYDRIICTCDTSIPISETSLIWIGIDPTYNSDGTLDVTSANYKVVAHPLDGLKNIRIAIKLIKKSMTINTSTTTGGDVI